MQKTIQQKIEELQADLIVKVENHNKALETKNTLFNEILELQGAMKALQELNVDTDTDTEAS